MNEDDTTGDVVLESTSPYATTDGGELELDFTALNDRATSAFDDVFSITVTDDDLERVWIAHEIDGVSFYEGGDPDATVDESNPLEASSGDASSIGLAIDTDVATSANETFAVRVEYADDGDDREENEGDREREETDPAPKPNGSAALEVTSTTVEPDRIEPGESATVTATVENIGNETGNTSAELAVGGAVVDAQFVELEPGESTTVVFEWRFDEPGEYAVAVSGTDAGTVTVTERTQYEVLNRTFTSSSAVAVAPAAIVGFVFAVTGVRRREIL